MTFKPDRHYGNFGVLFDTETMEPISMCPVFDNNRSLFPDLNQGQLENPDWYLQKCKAMIGKDFLVTARGLLTPEIKPDLIGFQFAQYSRITAPQERLDALGKIKTHRSKQSSNNTRPNNNVRTLKTRVRAFFVQRKPPVQMHTHGRWL